jgi:hypothetical protein
MSNFAVEFFQRALFRPYLAHKQGKSKNLGSVHVLATNKDL